MATLYWGPVSGSGSGTWSSTSTTNWYSDLARTTLAGVAPTSADDVIFDTSSNVGAYTVTMASGAVCQDITAYHPSNGQFLTFSFNTGTTTNFTVYGNVALGGNITLSSSTISGWVFTTAAGATNKTIDFGKINTNTKGMIFNAAGTVWTFVGNGSTSHGSISISSGFVDFGNINQTFTSFSSSGTGVRGVNLGNCQLTFSTGGAWWSTATTTNMSFIAGTSYILSDNTGGSVQSMAVASTAGPGLTFNNVAIMAPLITISGNATFNNLTFGPTTLATPAYAQISGNIIVDNVLDFGGNSTNKQVRRSVISTGAQVANSSTISANSVVNLHNIDFENIQAAGNNVPWSGTYLGNGGGTANITFNAPQTYYWNLAAGGSFFSNAYATVSGGTVNANNYPLAQDTVIFDDASLNAGANIIIHRTNAVIPSLDFSSRTNTAYFFGNTAATINIYGNLNLGANTFLGYPNLSSQLNIQFKGGAPQSVNSNRLTNQSLALTVTKNSYSSLVVTGNVGSLQGNPSVTRVAHNCGNIVLNGGNLIVAQYTAGTASNVSLDWKHLEKTGPGEIFLYSTSVGTILSISGSNPNFRIWGEPWFTAYGAGNFTRTLNNSDNQPLPSRWVNFRIPEGSGVLQVGSSAAYFNDFNTVGYTGNVDFRSVTIRGNLTLSSSHTVPPFNNGADVLTLSNPDPIAKTINTANIQLNKPITIAAGGWQLSNNLSISSNVGGTTGFNFSIGDFRMNGYDLFTPRVTTVSVTSIRSWFLGSGNVVLTGIGNVWSIGATISNFTFGANTSTIIIADTTSNAKGFVGGGLTYSNVRIGT